MKNKVLLIVGMLVLAVFVSAAVAGTASKKSDAAAVPSANYVLGSSQSANTDVFAVSITKVNKNNAKDYAFGYDTTTDSMLIVDLTVTNLTNQPQTLAPSTQLYLRTSDGLYITMHPSMYITEQLQFGEIAPRTKATGQISFVVPNTVKRPLLYVDLGWDGHVPVVYDILH